MLQVRFTKLGNYQYRVKLSLQIDVVLSIRSDLELNLLKLHILDLLIKLLLIDSSAVQSKGFLP